MTGLHNNLLFSFYIKLFYNLKNSLNLIKYNQYNLNNCFKK